MNYLENVYGRMEMPPFRTLDDFITTSARFQLPDFNNFERWGNRVTKNFLYYQTNYFAMAFLIIVGFLVAAPRNTILGFMITVAGLHLYIKYGYRLRDWVIRLRHPRTGAIVEQIRLYAIAITIAFFFIYWLWDAFVYNLLAILVPFCLAFVHASLRLRNIRNKIINTVDERLRYTPMGVFLEAMSIQMDGFFHK